MEPIIFTTNVDNEPWLKERAEPLRISAQYFHPEIPFKIYGPEEVAKMSASYPVPTRCPCSGIKALTGRELSKSYERVVVFDADSVIVSRLDEIINLPYTVAGVRAFSDHGALQNFSPDSEGVKIYEGFCKDKNRQNWLNCGLTAAHSQEFWNDWHETNLKYVSTIHNMDEGTFNKLVYEKYLESLLVLDSPNSSVYYGTASTWGEKTAWDSWKSIELKDEKLYLKNVYGKEKQVKVLHEAGHGFPSTSIGGRFNYDKLFQPEVANFLKRITSIY